MSNLRTPISQLTQSDVPDVKCDMVVDSGAFTAWTKREVVDLDAYCEYVHQLKDKCDHYVNLDVIPGEFGRVAGQAEAEVAAQQGWDNLKYMENQGLHPMPVFHQGDDFKWLALMVEEGYDYLGISPANDRTTNQRIEWLDDVFEVLTNAEGLPLVRTHGLAATSPKILRRYPWFSCDSTSWRVPGDMGQILVPGFNPDGSYDYVRTSEKVSISPKSPATKKMNEHLHNFTPKKREMVLQYIAEQRHSVAALENDYKERNSLNAKYWLEFERTLKVTTFRNPKRGFFKSKRQVQVSKTEAHPFVNTLEHKKLIFALAPDPNTSIVLCDNDVKRRLFSFWYYGKSPKNSIAEIRNYIDTGKVAERLEEDEK